MMKQQMNTALKNKAEEVLTQCKNKHLFTFTLKSAISNRDILSLFLREKCKMTVQPFL